MARTTVKLLKNYIVAMRSFQKSAAQERMIRSSKLITKEINGAGGRAIDDHCALNWWPIRR